MMDSSALPGIVAGLRGLALACGRRSCGRGLPGHRSTVCGLRSLGARGDRWSDLAAVLQLVLPVDDDEFAAVETGAEANEISSGLCQSDGPNLDGVVRIDGVHVGALGPALDGGGGHDDQILLNVDEKMNIHKLIGEEQVLAVVEDGFELVSAGSGVDLVVDGEKFTGLDFVGVITVEGLDTELATAAQLRGDLRKLVLRKGKDNGDGLKLGDDEQAVGVAGVNNVAGIHEAEADAAADRCGDVAIGELQLGIIDLPLIGANGAVELADLRGLGIELLLGNDAFLE